jgi:hypothetical protein
MRTRGVSKDRRGKGFSTLDRPGIVDPMASLEVNSSLSGAILSSWLMEIGVGIVSLGKKKVTSEAIRENVAGIAQERK